MACDDYTIIFSPGVDCRLVYGWAGAAVLAISNYFFSKFFKTTQTTQTIYAKASCF